MTDWALYLKMKIQNWLKLKKRSCCVGRMSNHVTGSCLLRASSPLDLLNWFRFSLFQFSYSKNWDFDQKTISKRTGTLKTIKKDFQWILFFFFNLGPIPKNKSSKFTEIPQIFHNTNTWTYSWKIGSWKILFKQHQIHNESIILRIM